MAENKDAKEVKKVTTNTIQKMKQAGEKISMITAYDYSFAKIFDEAGIDIILVGRQRKQCDGRPYHYPAHNTWPKWSTMPKAWWGPATGHWSIVDIPFGYYQSNSEIALASAIRIMKESGAHTVSWKAGKRSLTQ